MVLGPKLRRFDDDDIVKYGVDVPVVGVQRGRESRELRDMALAFGASLHLPKPAKAGAEPAVDVAPAPSPPARPRRLTPAAPSEAPAPVAPAEGNQAS